MVQNAGVHAVHVSTEHVPHPRNRRRHAHQRRPADTRACSKGRWTFRNYLGFRYFGWLVDWVWCRKQPFRTGGRIDPDKLEGFADDNAKAMGRGEDRGPHGRTPASRGIGRVIRDGSCDAVTIARPLLANPDLPLALLEGLNGPRQAKCTYSNKCLLHVIEHPSVVTTRVA